MGMRARTPIRRVREPTGRVGVHYRQRGVEPRPGVVVVGAGGHALVCIEVLREAGIEVAGCVSSDGTTSADLGALGVPMLGTDRDLATLVAGGRTQWFVAVGDNATRGAPRWQCWQPVVNWSRRSARGRRCRRRRASARVRW